jgi:hypothetical protein
MAAKKQVPVLTQAEFDANLPALEADLKREYAKWKLTPNAPPPNAATRGAFAHVPDIDSKTVIKASPIIKKHLGIKLDPKLIRRGGYNSFDDWRGDLVPKLRALCPVSAPALTPNVSTDSTSEELHER